MITIYTDGSCLGNPGPGGWAILIFKHKQSDNLNNIKRKKRTGGEKHTTNNRMEIEAMLNALQYTEKHSKKNELVNIFSDSQLVVNFCNTWRYNWEKANFLNNKKEPRPNSDLWKEINKLLNSTRAKINISWVKAHDNNKYNNRVDELARESANNYK